MVGHQPCVRSFLRPLPARAATTPPAAGAAGLFIEISISVSGVARVSDSTGAIGTSAVFGSLFWRSFELPPLPRARPSGRRRCAADAPRKIAPTTTLTPLDAVAPAESMTLRASPEPSTVRTLLNTTGQCPARRSTFGSSSAPFGVIPRLLLPQTGRPCPTQDSGAMTPAESVTLRVSSGPTSAGHQDHQ